MSSESDNKNSVRKAVHEEAAFNAAFVVMNVIATVIACAGLFENSPAVVIGAMVVAVLLGPIVGLALAIVDGEIGLLHRSLFSVLAGTLIVIATAFLIGEIFQDLPLTDEIRSRTGPNILDLLIALGGGAAVGAATALPRLNLSFVGVAIATALIPPLSVAGILLARYEYYLAFNAFLLAFTNFVGIQCASSAVFWVLGFRHIFRRHYVGQNLVPRVFASSSALLILAMVLSFHFIHHLEKYRFETTVRHALDNSLVGVPGSFLADLRFEPKYDRIVVIAVIRTPEKFTPSQVADFEASLPSFNGKPIELHVRSVLTTETTRMGDLNKPS